MLDHYLCLPKKAFEDGKGHTLVAVRLQDIELIRQWRNSQIPVLRQLEEISAESQVSYFERMIWPTFAEAQPRQLLFSYLYQGVLIGYGGLVAMDWAAKRAEVSFLLDPARTHPAQAYAADFTSFLHLLCQVAFKTLKFHRLFTETFAFRKDHMAVLEDFGLKREGILRDHVFKNGKWVDSYMHGLLAGEYRDDS